MATSIDPISKGPDFPTSSAVTPSTYPTMETVDSTPSSETIRPHHTDQDLTLKRRPWRRHVTPWSKIISEPYKGAGTEADPFLVDWLHGVEGNVARDPEHPMTWNDTYKWIVTMAVAVATLAVSMASSTLSGATASIMVSFPNYATQVYVMVTSAFVLGFVVGPLVFAPASEAFGRRYLFILTYIFFTIFNGGVIASQNIWTLIILRFFAGTAGSSPLTNAGGTVADLFDASERGLGMAVFAAAPFLGPALGPIIGGFLGETGGWRWVAALIAIFTALLTVMGALVVPETYSPVLLRRRANLLSKATGMVYRSKFEKDKEIQLGELFKVALGRPWKLLFMEPIVFLLSLYLAIIYATLYMLFGAFPIVFEELRGWTAGVSGLAFLGVLVGFSIALLSTIFYFNPLYVVKVEKAGGWLPPEARLIPAIVGGVLLPIGLFSFAWTAAPARIHWIAPIICSVPFGTGMVLVFLSVFNYLIDSYLIYAASVLAANSVLRSLFGVGFPLFVTPMFKNLGVNWAVTLIAFLALACAPMPILFYLYGSKIRTKSKFAREMDAIQQKIREAAKAQKEKGEA